MPTSHSGHHVEHTMLTDKISTLFTEAFNKFDPIVGQPTDSHLSELREVLSQTVLFIPYDKKNRGHKLVLIIQDPRNYTVDYTVAFPRSRKPAIYDASIHDNEKEPVRAPK